MKQQNLVMCVGIPGVGKSTWIRNNATENDVWVSRDSIRFSLLKPGDDYFKYENQVFSRFVATIQRHLLTGHRVFADATHINWASRSKLLRNLHNVGDIDVDVYVFQAPLHICIQRNAQRQARERVPENALRNMYRQFELPEQDPFRSYHSIQHIKTYTKEGGTAI